MSTNVEVPSVGESVTEAILLQWYKQPGDSVAEDEPLCELETDKANVDLPAPSAGVLEILVKAGETVAVGQVLGVLSEAGAAPAAPAPAAAPTPQQASPSPAASAPAPSPAAPAQKSAPSATSPTPEAQRPSVRRMAAEQGVDPSTVPGTGPGGVVTKEDMLSRQSPAAPVPSSPFSAAPQPPPSAAPAPSATPAPAQAPAVARASRPRVPGEERREPLSKIRKRIATRLVAAQQETAMLTTFNEVDLSRVIALRGHYKDSFHQAHGVKLGFMSFFTKAASLALMEFPAVNAFIDGDEVVYHDYVNIGVAVSTDRGLVVPVLKGVEQLSMGEIEGEIKRVAASARDGKLKLDEMSGGTFTITNGGVFGSMLSTPILNRPQSGILGMHAIQDRPVAVDGQVVIRPMMYLALSYDHRLIDGTDSVRFLVRIKQYLEDPARMLLQA